ncbi:MAG: GDSL-type esterase/lipase family protein [Planctomycetota bacterium]
MAYVGTFADLTLNQHLIRSRGGADSYDFQSVGGDLRYSVITQANSTLNLPAVNAGQVYVMMITHDGSNLKLFWDGTLADNNPFSSNHNGNGDRNILSRGTGIDPWHGICNAFVTWSRVLNDPEIAAFTADPYGSLLVDLGQAANTKTASRATTEEVISDPATAYADNLASSVGVNTNSATYRVRFTANESASDLRFLLTNHRLITGGHGDILVRAAIEPVGGGVPQLLTFDGDRELSLAKGEARWSDVVPYAVEAGDQLWLRTFVYCATPGGWPVGIRRLNEVANQLLAAGEDQLLTLGTAWGINPNNFAYSANAVIGRPRTATRRRVAVLGDSIPAGQGDITGPGYFDRAAAAQDTAVFNVARPGLKYEDIRNNPDGLDIACRTSSVLVVALGTNDIGSGQPSSYLQESLAIVASTARKYGCSLYAVTLLPRTTLSTGSVSTPTNQTVRTGEADRVAYNEWLRDGAGGLIKGVLDLDSVADPDSTGLWQAATSYDGIHPDTAGHIALAAAFDFSPVPKSTLFVPPDVNDVRVGVDRGDGSLGTFVAIDVDGLRNELNARRLDTVANGGAIPDSGSVATADKQPDNRPVVDESGNTQVDVDLGGVGDHVLAVTVTSTGGDVAGATVTVQTSTGVRHAVVQTNANGQATIGVSDDTYTLIVKATGYDSTTDNVEVDGANATKAITLTATANVEPPPAGYCNVTYRAEREGQPIAGLDVTLTYAKVRGTKGIIAIPPITKQTDAAGDVLFAVLQESLVDVQAGDVKHSDTIPAEANATLDAFTGKLAE